MTFSQDIPTSVDGYTFPIDKPRKKDVHQTSLGHFRDEIRSVYNCFTVPRC